MPLALSDLSSVAKDMSTAATNKMTRRFTRGVVVQARRGFEQYIISIIEMYAFSARM